MGILQTIENDLHKAEKFVATQVEGAATVLWNDVKPLLVNIEPVLYNNLRTVVAGILVAFEGKDLATIETAVLNVLSAGGSAILSEVQALGSQVLQMVIALVQSSGATKPPANPT